MIIAVCQLLSPRLTQWSSSVDDDVCLSVSHQCRYLSAKGADVVCWLVAWLSGSALVLSNVVTLRWARLILGWVTICRWVNHLGM